MMLTTLKQPALSKTWMARRPQPLLIWVQWLPMLAMSLMIRLLPPGQPSVGEPKLQSYSRRAKCKLRVPVLPVPDVQRTPVVYPPSATPRRSKRLAASCLKNVPAERRAQLLLAGRLGISLGNSLGNQEALNNFIKLFDKPLSKEHIAALAALFWITVPETLPLGIDNIAEAAEASSPLVAI